MNLKNLNSWNPDEERLLTDFGSAYVGYYIDRDNVRYVPYAGVRQEQQGMGLFKILLDELKKDMEAVVLCNPIDITQEVSMRQGYVYDLAINAMVWIR